MGIEALLKTRAETSGNTFSGVTRVTEVQPNNGAACRVTPINKSEVTRGYSIAETGDSVTPVTPCNPAEVTAKPAPNKACTLVTPVTPQKTSAEDKTNLARLVARVCYADGWQDADIWQAIRLALDDYDDALIAYTEQAAMRGVRLDDDRRGCFECAELSGSYCMAAKRGLIPGADLRGYEPVRYMMRRCDQFKTKG